jgi:hypothetical protein
MIMNRQRFPDEPPTTAPVEEPRHALEAHPGAATLYLTGRVSVPGFLGAMRLADELPGDAWVLRVDLTGARPLDEGTLRVLWHSLRRWRDRRSGTTLVVPPPGADSVVTEALHAPCKTMTRRAHLSRMLTLRR